MSQGQKEPIAIAYLPWADLQEEFAVGPVSFWPFYAKADQKIPDAEIRADLARFFEMFVDHTGRPVRSIVACSYDGICVRSLGEEDWRQIIAAVDCLIFAAITGGAKNAVCANNDSMAPPSADRFDLCPRWVWPCRGGVVIKTENSTNIWPQGKCVIMRPVSVGGPFCGNYLPLLDGLGRVFAPEFPADIRERLFRTLEWFRFAHTESPTVTWLNKVVMMATGFEILLELPDRDQTNQFAGHIERLLRLQDSCPEKRTDNKGREFEACAAAWWARDFYELRSRIVHGNQVTAADLKYRGWITHLMVADLVLRELVDRLLYQHGCIGERLRACVAKLAAESSESPEAFEAVMLPGMTGLDVEDVHEALGWIPPLDERRRRGCSE
jgi:hypothetical protein